MIAGRIFTFIFIFFCFLVPFFELIKRVSLSFTDFSFLALVFSPMAIHLLLQTLMLSVSTLVIVIIFSLGIGFVLNSLLKNKPNIASTLKFFISVYWVLPGLFFVLLTWNVLRGVGLNDWLYSFRAVQVGWVLGFTPYVTLGVMRIFSDLDVREIEAAKTLGATPSKLFQTIYFPRVLPALFSLSMQTVWLMLTSFSLVVVLGGGTPNDTLETSIYQAIRTFDVRFDRAFALSFWQGVLMFLLYSGRKLIEKKMPVGLEWTKPEDASRPKMFFASAFMILGAGVFLYTTPLQLLWLPWVQSLIIAVFSAVTTLGCAFVFYYSARFASEFGAMISPMILSLMWWESYSQKLNPLLLCVGVQVVLFLPWVSRTLYPLLDRKRSFELEAAQTLGAGKVRAWFTVEWPRLQTEIKMMLAWLMAFSMAEVSSVILFSKGEFEPLSVWAQNQMSRFRFEEGFAGVKLVILTTALLIFFASIPALSKRRAV